MGRMRKGSISFESIAFVFRMIFVILMAFSVFLLVRSATKVNIDVFEADADIMFQRIIYSNNTLQYFDSGLERVYPGIIDFDNFKSGTFEQEFAKSINYGQEKRHFAAKISVTDINEKKEYVKYYNKEFYDYIGPVAQAGYTKGPGGARTLHRETFVLLKEKDSLKEGMLKADIVIAND